MVSNDGVGNDRGGTDSIVKKRMEEKMKISKRLIAVIMGFAMVTGAAGLATAATVQVDPTPAMLVAYAQYGIDSTTLEKASQDLTAAERQALQAIYDDVDIRAAINGTVLSELWAFVPDDQTIATVTLAGKVFMVGMPDAL